MGYRKHPSIWPWVPFRSVLPFKEGIDGRLKPKYVAAREEKRRG
jgi:hypothetical protein